jgi:hypothetical protein
MRSVPYFHCTCTITHWFTQLTMRPEFALRLSTLTTPLLLPAQNTHTLHDPIRDTEHRACASSGGHIKL